MEERARIPIKFDWDSGGGGGREGAEYQSDLIGTRVVEVGGKGLNTNQI